jgi:sugar phosphate isomerase/epimerase
MEKFIEGYKKLESISGDLELYLENNVLSTDNLKNFRTNPFFLTTSEEFKAMKKRINFKLLLDTGHLKVSCKALNLSFRDELERLLQETDYIHISDNDGLADQNGPLVKNSELFQFLKRTGIKGKTVTLEVYGGEAALKTSYENVLELTA